MRRRGRDEVVGVGLGVRVEEMGVREDNLYDISQTYEHKGIPFRVLLIQDFISARD